MVTWIRNQGNTSFSSRVRIKRKKPQKAPKDNSSCCSIHLWKLWQKGNRSSLPSHNVTIHLCDMSATLMSPWSSNCHLQTRLLTQNPLTKPLPTTPQRSSQTLEVKVRGWGYCSTIARVCFNRQKHTWTVDPDLMGLDPTSHGYSVYMSTHVRAEDKRGPETYKKFHRGTVCTS